MIIGVGTGTGAISEDVVGEDVVAAADVVVAAADAAVAANNLFPKKG